VLWTLCLLLVLLADASGQYPDLHIFRTTEEIKIDGALDEQAYRLFQNTQPSFHQQFPIDTGYARSPTEFFMTYDEEKIYVGMKLYSNASDYVVTSLKRDYSFGGNDNISILFDTYNDQNNAFLFGMNTLGVRREALISNGGTMRGDFAGSWDNKWEGQVKDHGDYWVAEFAIPFKTLRYKDGSTQWRFNSYRWDTEINEISTWNRIPQNQIIMNLAHMGNLIWDEPLKKPGTNVSLIPYATTSVFRDFDDPTQSQPSTGVAIGGDAKISVTPGLNLDLTINPDFSQVEVDQQVTNLDRFELFFPERRQFFLENADLFSGFGNRRVNPFFSRRIGIAIDSTTGQNIQNKILFGARLSGKLNERLRVGLLNTQTEKITSTGLPGFNYTVAAVEQRVFKRSNLAFIFVNKQATNPDENAINYLPHNRVAGLEYRLITPDNKWSGKTFYHRVFSASTTADKFTHGLSVEYLQPRYRLEWSHMIVGQGYDAEVGFAPRKDFFLASPEFQLYWPNGAGNLARHDLTVDTRFFYELGKKDNNFLDPFSLSEWQIDVDWDFRFRDNRSISIGLQHTDVLLLRDFDPTRIQKDGIFLKAGTDYSYTQAQLMYSSDDTRLFSYELSPSIGTFFNGLRAGIEGQITYRYQPYGFVSLDFAYNYLELDAPFEATRLWLIGPRIDLTFSKKLFLTTFFQYNSQFENLNINARLQWRFAPVSDFFIVYTDNYLWEPFSQFSSRNRALVAKVTYWLNL